MIGKWCSVLKHRYPATVDVDMAILLLVLLSVFSAPAYSIQQPLVQGRSIDVTIYYDLNSDFGAMNIVYSLGEAVNSTIVELPLPLLRQGSYTWFSVEDPDGSPLLYDYLEDKYLLKIYVNESLSSIIVHAALNGISEEIGIGAYVLYIDYSNYTGIPVFHSQIIVVGAYNVSVFSGTGASATVRKTSNTTIVELNQPDTYTLIYMEEITGPITPTTTPGGGGTTTGLPPEGVVPSGPSDMLPYIVIGIIAVIAGVAAYIVYRRRRYEPSLTTLEPGDILSDETTKQIILIVGDAGVEGIKQSQLVRQTNRPKSTISRRLKRLADEGYVEIIHIGKHNIVRLTAKGLEAYKRFKEELSGGK